jgi:hypothetical protein
VIAIAILTLQPDPRAVTAAARTPLTCLICGDRGSVDVVLNILLFIPFGFGLRLAGWPWRRVAAAAFVLSFTVETLQYFVITGRDASLGDVVSNSTGGVLGAALVPLGFALWAPSPRLAGRLLIAGCLIWVLLLAAAAWLQAPGAQTWHLNSRWAHHAPDLYPFFGVVESVTLNGNAMPPQGPPPDRGEIAKRLKRGEATLAIDALSGAPTEDHHWVYLMKAGRIPQLSLTQKGRSAVLMVPARASRYKLRPPTLSLADGFPSRPGVPVSLGGGRHGDTVWVKTSYAGEERAIEIRLSPSHGWVMIAPFNFPLGPALRLVTGLWLALWTIPLGYWGARTRRPAWAAGLIGVTLAVGLGAVPALGGYAPVHWSEWLSAALSAAAGWALLGPAAYLQLRCGSPSISVSSSS